GDQSSAGARHGHAGAMNGKAHRRGCAGSRQERVGGHADPPDLAGENKRPGVSARRWSSARPSVPSRHRYPRLGPPSAVLNIVLDRLEYLCVRPIETRAEVVGVDSLYPGSGPVTTRTVAGTPEPYEARVRVAARARTQDEAEMVVHEVDSLELNRPSGG